MDTELRCRFCHRYVIDGLYVRVSFPDGVSNVCDDCMAKRDDGYQDRMDDIARWRDTEVEVV